MSLKQSGTAAPACVEHGIWTPVLTPPPRDLDSSILDYKEVDRQDHDRVTQLGRMSVHMVGCTGDFTDHAPQEAVAAAMAAQINDPGGGGSTEAPATNASFLYHLGDVIYKPGATSDTDSNADEPDEDRGLMYNDQFYSPYSVYERPIFAIAGNHDGKYSPHWRKSALDHFFTNFCAKNGGTSPDNNADSRPVMTQPYIYWQLNTPQADFIGLYSNIANGGLLDDPSGPDVGLQYQWLVSQLRAIRTANATRSSRKAIVLAVHYPPIPEQPISLSAATLAWARPMLGPRNLSAPCCSERLPRAASARTSLFRRTPTCTNALRTAMPTAGSFPCSWPAAEGMHPWRNSSPPAMERAGRRERFLSARSCLEISQSQREMTHGLLPSTINPLGSYVSLLGQGWLPANSSPQPLVSPPWAIALASISEAIRSCHPDDFRTSCGTLHLCQSSCTEFRAPL